MTPDTSWQRETEWLEPGPVVIAPERMTFIERRRDVDPGLPEEGIGPTAGPAYIAKLGLAGVEVGEVVGSQRVRIEGREYMVGGSEAVIDPDTRWVKYEVEVYPIP